MQVINNLELQPNNQLSDMVIFQMRTAVNVLMALTFGLAKLQLILENRCYCILIESTDKRLSQVN